VVAVLVAVEPAVVLGTAERVEPLKDRRLDFVESAVVLVVAVFAVAVHILLVPFAVLGLAVVLHFLLIE